MKILVLVMAITITGCSENRSTKASVVPSTEAQFASGEHLFVQNCSRCHGTPGKTMEQSLFSGTIRRLPEPGETYFINFVKDSKKLRDAGDEYALNLDSAYFESDYEHAFSSFSEQDFKDLILYIETAGNH